MELKNQVCNLEFAKKFEELGLKQASLFSWVTGRKNKWVDKRNEGYVAYNITYEERVQWSKSGFGVFAAFTVAELGEMLPFEIVDRKNHVSHSVQKGVHFIWWFGDGYKVEASTEADARAKMLIYLLENNLL
jgi:hypothetical protein